MSAHVFKYPLYRELDEHRNSTMVGDRCGIPGQTPIHMARLSDDRSADRATDSAKGFSSALPAAGAAHPQRRASCSRCNVRASVKRVRPKVVLTSYPNSSDSAESLACTVE